MHRIRLFNISDLFVGLWALYYMQGMLYPQGIINQCVQLIMILMGLVSLGKCIITKANSSLIVTSALLVLMYILYGGVIILFGDGIPWTTDSTYLKNSLNSLLPIFFFYLQTKNANLTENRIRIYTLIMLLCVMLFYSFVGQKLLLEQEVEETTNNIGYMFVALIPFVFFGYKNPIFQYVLLAILMLYILLGMKRGAIAIGAMLVVIFIYSQFKEGTGKRKVYALALSIIFILCAIYFVEYMNETSEYFAQRVESTIQGNNSGRNRLYSSVWSAVSNEENIIRILFGHGANSTIKYAGNFAHQDWLETMCNNGLLGVCLLIAFFVSFGNTVLKSRRSVLPHYYYCFLTLFALSLSKTLFSMSIQGFDMYQGMLIGYFACVTSNPRITKLKM